MARTTHNISKTKAQDKVVVDWRIYSRKRIGDVKTWLKRKGLKNFAEVCALLDDIGVSHPQESEMKALFKEIRAEKQPSKPKAPRKKKAAAKSTTSEDTEV